MNLTPWQFRYAGRASLGGDLGALHRHRGHTHKAMSRRRFIGSAAGTMGLLLGASFLSPAQATRRADPKPIPGGFSEFGHFYHQLYPNEDTAHTEDPSTITDFNGHIGLAYVIGTGTHTDKMTGIVSQLPYRVDLRFMKGCTSGRTARNTTAPSRPYDWTSLTARRAKPRSTTSTPESETSTSTL
jgi:hypothetical protein